MQIRLQRREVKWNINWKEHKNSKQIDASLIYVNGVNVELVTFLVTLRHASLQATKLNFFLRTLELLNKAKASVLPHAFQRWPCSHFLEQQRCVSVVGVQCANSLETTGKILWIKDFVFFGRGEQKQNFEKSLKFWNGCSAFRRSWSWPTSRAWQTHIQTFTGRISKCVCWVKHTSSKVIFYKKTPKHYRGLNRFPYAVCVFLAIQIKQILQAVGDSYMYVVTQPGEGFETMAFKNNFRCYSNAYLVK